MKNKKLTLKKSCHNEFGTIHDLFIKTAQSAFISKDHLEKNWKNLNYLKKPKFKKAVEEYANFENILKQECKSIKYFPENKLVNMDSIYCRDASIATNKGMIICNMGKPARSHEPTEQKNHFKQLGIPILGCIENPGTIEGGDVAWLDENTLAVGHSYRTNESGIEQLKKLLLPLKVNVVVAPLPHYKGTNDVFHLMSIFSPLAKDIALIYSPLMPIAFRELLIKKGYQLIEVPDSEFESMGCNVLALSSKKCLMVKGNPKTKAALKLAGLTVIEYEGEEISVKGGGGPTCLTRPLWREI